MPAARPPSAPADPRDRIIVALDVPGAEDAFRLLDRLGDAPHRVKIGLELFTASGPGFVRAVAARGLRVFLDLKFHDIPNTAARAMASIGGLGVEMATLHLAGGRAMIAAAATAARAAGIYPLGVTVLTSLDAAALRETGVPDPPASHVLRLARLGAEAGLDGFVAAAHEAPLLREALGTPRIVCPGIRPAHADPGDQRRAATPAGALRLGATELVIGRPITAAPDPRSAFLAIAEEIAGA